MNSLNKSKNSGTVLVLLSALMFGSYGVWARLIGNSMGGFYQGWTRALIIVALLLPVALARNEITKIQKDDRVWLAVFLVFTSFTLAPIFYAFNHMDIGTASLLFFVVMFLTINVIGVTFYKEKLTKIKIISALLAVCGMYLVFSFSLTSSTFYAVLMAVVGGIASGGEVAFSKKLSKNYSALYINLLAWAIILPTNLLFSLILKEPQPLLDLSYPWLWQLCFSVAALFGFWLVIIGFKYVDAGVGALVGLLEIVFSIIFGIWVFKEPFTIAVGLGGLLIIIAAALPHIQEIFKDKFKPLFT